MNFAVNGFLLFIAQALSFRTVIEDDQVLLALVETGLLLENLLRHDLDLIDVPTD